MKFNRKSHFFPLVVCMLLAITGCATSPGYSSTEKEEMQGVSAVTKSSESAILPEVSNMNIGEKVSINNITFVAGETYTAASGRHCRIVAISKDVSAGISRTRERVVCKNDQGWFFPKDVFLRVSESGK